jgi:hypothetical protein
MTTLTSTVARLTTPPGYWLAARADPA